MNGNRAAVLVLGVAAAAVRCGAATISGQVLDWSQRPIYGARVDISAVPGSVAMKPFQAAKLTVRDGTFTFTVNAGSYRICVSVRRNTVLNPCVWSMTPPGATVTQEQTLTMKPMVMARGYPLKVQLNDTTGVLAQETAKKSANVVLVGVTAPDGMYHPMPVAQANAQFREHSMMVPRDTPMQVSVLNQGFAMVDAAGKAVGSGTQTYRFNAVIAGERNPRVFAFTVSALAAIAKAGN